jgi:uncharacterized protein YjbI with pentapeptide repeats
MEANELDRIIDRYISAFPTKGVAPSVLQSIEKSLGKPLPADFKRIAKVFPGGKIGDFAHAQLAADGPKSIVALTLDCRGKFGLADNFIVLGGPKSSFIVLDTNGGIVMSVPRYCRHSFKSPQPQDLKYPAMETYLTYGEFFASLLVSAATDRRRKQIRSSVPQLKRSQITALRSRWDDKSRLVASRFLLTGVPADLPFPPVELDGEPFADLRGIPLLDHHVQRIGDDAWYDLYQKWLKLTPEQQAVRTGKATPFEFDPDTHVRLSRIDLSYFTRGNGGSSFSGLDMQNCRFVGGQFPQWVGERFVGCDFSAAQVKNRILHSEYRNCIFVGADLSQSGGKATYVNCDFSGADFRTAHFMECVFDHCIWDAARFGFGSLAKSRFIGTAPRPEDLGDTIMDGCVFDPPPAGQQT